MGFRACAGAAALMLLLACSGAVADQRKAQHMELLQAAKGNPLEHFKAWLAQHGKAYANDAVEFTKRCRCWDGHSKGSGAGARAILRHANPTRSPTRHAPLTGRPASPASTAVQIPARCACPRAGRPGVATRVLADVACGLCHELGHLPPASSHAP